MSINDTTTINGVRLVAVIDGKEARIRFFAAPFISTEGVHVLDTDEWYRLAQAQPNYDRVKRERDQLRELCQRPKESLSSYVQRIDELQTAHYDGCRNCNYDEECNQCNADDDGDAHSCNCSEGIGYGCRLSKTLEMARMALAATESK